MSLLPWKLFKREAYAGELEDLFLCDTECPFTFNMWGSLP